MARTSTYLNFTRNTEEAFVFYEKVFGTKIVLPVSRFKDIFPQTALPQLSEADQNLIIHIELPILGGHLLMGTNAPKSIGFTLKQGNNVYINLELDTLTETNRLFMALAEGGIVEMPLQDMFWGGNFGNLSDQFGVKWMFNCTSKN
jgi:PhnB protein